MYTLETNIFGYQKKKKNAQVWARNFRNKLKSDARVVTSIQQTNKYVDIRYIYMHIYSMYVCVDDMMDGQSRGSGWAGQDGRSTN